MTRRHQVRISPAARLCVFPGVGIGDLGLTEIGVGVLGAGLADDLGCGDLAAEAFEVGVDGQLAAIIACRTLISH
jgi:hypothetical protein